MVSIAFFMLISLLKGSCPLGEFEIAKNLNWVAESQVALKEAGNATLPSPLLLVIISPNKLLLVASLK